MKNPGLGPDSDFKEAGAPSADTGNIFKWQMKRKRGCFFRILKIAIIHVPFSVSDSDPKQCIPDHFGSSTDPHTGQ
jgi:hypothetical protein